MLILNLLISLSLIEKTAKSSVGLLLKSLSIHVSELALELLLLSLSVLVHTQKPCLVLLKLLEALSATVLEDHLVQISSLNKLSLSLSSELRNSNFLT